MSQRSRDKRSYLRAAALTADAVAAFKAHPPPDLGEPPDFVFPAGVALGMSIVDVGDYIAKNTAARVLVIYVCEIFLQRSRGPVVHYPTVTMLQAALDLNGIPSRLVPLSEMGFPGELVRLTGPGVARA